MSKPLSILITCEHAVHDIPLAFKTAFAPHTDLLLTHRGYDIGAQSIARKIVSIYQFPYFEATVSRLLIECNRSLHHPDCFSFISKPFDSATKQAIIDTFYLPYRQAVLSHIQSRIKNHTILHLSIHSFTPNLRGIERNADLGLLYHPSRKNEQVLAIQWQQWVSKQAPHYAIRRNYPYLGKSDGLTQSCRQQFSEDDYLGFEIEWNQKHLIDSQARARVEELMVQWMGVIHS